MNFRYAHLADLHLGSWSDQKMRDLSTKAFLTAMDECIKRKVDFILFAGDLFNTSLPSLDTLKIVTAKLKELHDQNIPLYALAGSHDFSPSGKTMLDVLEKAGLLKNVCKGKVDHQKKLHLNFLVDPKTSCKITGILGRRGLLDKTYYENLALEPLEQEPGYKIFLFHTTVTELLPVHLGMIESQPISFFPRYFQYYAGGHIHHPTKMEIPGYGTVTYPGALFPNNFAEIEKYGKGWFYLITVENTQQDVKLIPLEIIKHLPVVIDCRHHSPEFVPAAVMKEIQNQELTNTLITIRLKGRLEKGKVSDINFKEIFQQLYSRGAYFVMKNTAKLVSPEFAEIKIAPTNPEKIEEEIIKEHLNQMKLFTQDKELELINRLLSSLNTTKKEGETSNDFEERIKSNLNSILELKIPTTATRNIVSGAS